MALYNGGSGEGEFDKGIERGLRGSLVYPDFVFRIERDAAGIAPGAVYRLSEVEVASRLSFLMWSSIPDDELLALAEQGRLHNPVTMQRQVRRMLKDPRASALAVNFAGQWLNLRGLQAVGPLPNLYPDFDDPLRQAMRCEVELLFDSIVREDRNVVELLTADDTFVNERLAKHYGIPNIYGSQFRRVTLGPDMDLRRGLLGKGAILTTTSKPDSTNRRARSTVWIASNSAATSPSFSRRTASRSWAISARKAGCSASDACSIRCSSSPVSRRVRKAPVPVFTTCPLPFAVGRSWALPE